MYHREPLVVAWKDLARLPEPELARFDIAETNLACAEGLPDSIRIETASCCRTLDAWAEKVRWQTQKQFRRYERDPGEYNNSQGYFRALVLITVLQRDCGVSYNLAKIPAEATFGIEDTFIHGVTNGTGGTCATMPVVYCAIGRRLGYPLKLVDAHGPGFGHLFVRWDDPDGERFNIEATAQGLSCHPDEYYRSGFYAKTRELEKRGQLLHSHSPREELAMFLVQRGWLWMDQANYRQAADSFAWACGLAPRNQLHLACLERAMNFWRWWGVHPGHQRRRPTSSCRRAACGRHVAAAGNHSPNFFGIHKCCSWTDPRSTIEWSPS